MNDVAEAVAPKAKAPREVEIVEMSDGRSVEFVGKRKLLKETIVDDATTSVSVRLDFRNGETRLFTVPDSLLLKAAGHGMEQKLGDECAGVEKVDDMVLAVDALIGQLSEGKWSAGRAEGDGFSGASIVIRAIMETSGKDQTFVKSYLQKKLDEAAAKGEKLTRQALYASFKNPATKIGQTYARLEAEERAGKSVLNADEALAELA